MSFAEDLKIKKDEVETFLREISFEEMPEPLKSSVKYSLLDGGKRIRPILFLECFRMFGGKPTESVKKFACAIECVHIYSLIHDDLPCMDDDDFRRGKPTNHKVYGENIAVLAGDALLNLAYELIFDAVKLSGYDKKYIEAATMFSDSIGGKGLIAGQTLDIVSGKEAMTAETLDYIYKHKTGDLIKAAMVAGATIAGADDDEIKSVSSYADGFGFAFQIKDDLLDYEEYQKGSDNDYVAVFGETNAKKALDDNIGKAVKALSELNCDTEFLKNLALRSAVRKQ